MAAPIGGKNLEQFVSDNIGKARTSPEEYLKFRKELEDHFFSQFGSTFRGGEKSENARVIISQFMSTYLGDRTNLLNVVTRDFAANCRRLTPRPDDFEALTEDDVGHMTGPIEKFTRT